MSHLYLLGVATLTLTSASFAGSDTNADLQARLEAAETRISELSAVTNANWLNDTRADEIRGLVHDVLADADTRASLQGSGATAGYNGGFTVGSADGNWSLKINGLLQTRWTSVDIDAGSALPLAGTGSQWGFSNARTWVNFSGTIAGDYSYDIRHNMNARDAGNDWANGSMDLSSDWALTMGSMKAATSREALIGDQNQLAMDRDVNFAVGQGAQLAYTGDDLRVTMQLFNGGAAGAANQSSYTYTLRGEFMVEGAGWGQFDEFTSADGGAAGTLIGFSYSAGDDGDLAGTTLTDRTTWNLDCQMQFGGSNLYVSYNDFSDDGTAAPTNTDVNSLQVMYGIFLDSEWELYGRYIDSDGTEAPAGALDGSVFAIGVNNYFAGQNCKWTTEIIMDDSATANNSDVTTVATQLQFYF